jgi:multidrug transporter EmrE-like cation transporter
MLYIALAVFGQSVALTLGKFAGMSYEGFARYTSLAYAGSLTALLFQAVVWQQALKRYPLSFAYPFMSAVFIIIPVVSVLVFKESLSVGQIAGAVLIALGTIQLTRRIPERKHL